MMTSSAITPALASSRSGMYFTNYDLYSAYSKEYSVPDLSARFGSLTHEWSMLSAKDTPRTSATPGLSFLSNQQIYKRVLEWFEVWRPWQQRMLLCGLTNRCSTNQLESLATALEPIFHRDFAITLKHRYPSASFKFKSRQPLFPVRGKSKASKRAKPKAKRTNSNVSSRNQTRNIIRANSRSTVDGRVTGDTSPKASAGSLPRIPDIPTSGGGLIGREETEILLPAVTKNVAVSDMDPLEHPGPEELLALEPATERAEVERPKAATLEEFAESVVHEIMAESVKQLDVELNLRQLVAVTDAVDNVTLPGRVKVKEKTSSTLASSVLKPTSSTTLPSKSSSKRVRIRGKEEPLVVKSLPIQGSDMLKFSLVDKTDMVTSNPTQHHNAWASHVMPDDVKPEENLIVKENYKTHRHKSAIKSMDELHAADFFKLDRFQVFASYRADAPFAHLKRPDLIEDVNIPVQKFYKSTRWFPETPREGTVYVKPDSAHLKTHFREQIEQIWEWMESWQDFEKLHLLKRIIKLCNADLINYLAQCLFTRLHDRCGLNWLPDKLLLLIFSYMQYEDIESCSQVCRRWKYLTSVEELWMLKCHEHGVSNGIRNITRQIAENSARDKQEVDWKLAYFEVQEITNEAKATLPVPQALTFEAPTPEGMERVHGKFLPADIDGSVVSDFHSVSTLPDNLSQISAFPRGLGARLAHESDKLKKAFRDKQRHLAERARLQAEEEERERQRELNKSRLSAEQSTLTDDASTDATSKGPSRASNVLSRLRRAGRDSQLSMNPSDMDDEGHLAALQEEPERLPTPPPADLAEWVSRMAKGGEERDVSLDVRHELVQATDVIPKKLSSEELLRRSQTSLGDIRKVVKKDKEKENKESSLIQSVRRVRRFYGHMDSVLCLALSRRRLVTASLDRSIRVFDNRDGTTIHKLCGHKGAVTCLAFDNELLYSGSWDTTVMVWDLIYFERVAVLHGHKGSVTCMAQDRHQVLSGSHDGTVRVWSKMTLLCHKVLTPHKLHIHAMEYDGTFVYSASSDRRHMIYHEYSPIRVRGYVITQFVECLLNSKSPRDLSLDEVHQDGSIVVTNVATEEQVLVFTGHPDPFLYITIQGSLLITSNIRGQVWFWNKDTGRAEAAIQAHDAPVTCVRYHDGRFFTASSDMMIKEWDMHTMTCLRTLVGHKGAVNTLVLTGEKLISGDSTGQVRVWDFVLPLMKLGDDDVTLEHDIVEERELLKPKPPPTPPSQKDKKRSRKKKKKKKREDGEEE